MKYAYVTCKDSSNRRRNLIMPPEGEFCVLVAGLSSDCLYGSVINSKIDLAGFVYNFKSEAYEWKIYETADELLAEHFVEMV